MPGPDARWIGIAGGVLLTGCFKLNPDFVEAGADSDGSTVTLDGSATAEGIGERVTDGLRLLYVFDEASCQTPGIVQPTAGAEPLELNVGCAACGAGGLVVDAGCNLPALSDGAVSLGSGAAFTLEAWVSIDTEDEANLMGQEGSFSLTADASRRAGLRLDITNTTGPPLVMGAAERQDQQPWHLGVTYDSGSLLMFIDTAQVGDSQPAPIQWSGAGPLQIGGTANRPWSGTIYLLAIYDRALDYSEYCQNHAASSWSDGGC